MKKVNFVVIFWLTLAIISFIALLISANSVFDGVAYLIIPDKGEYSSQDYIVRRLITSIPMLIIEAGAFYLGIKQGMSVYKDENNTNKN